MPECVCPSHPDLPWKVKSSGKYNQHCSCYFCPGDFTQYNSECFEYTAPIKRPDWISYCRSLEPFHNGTFRFRFKYADPVYDPVTGQFNDVAKAAMEVLDESVDEIWTTARAGPNGGYVFGAGKCLIVNQYPKGERIFPTENKECLIWRKSTKMYEPKNCEAEVHGICINRYAPQYSLRCPT